MPGALRRTLRLHSVRNPIGSKRPPVTQGSVPKRHRELILRSNARAMARHASATSLCLLLRAERAYRANGDTSECDPKQKSLVAELKAGPGCRQYFSRIGLDVFCCWSDP